MSKIETITVNGTTYDVGGSGGASISPTPSVNVTEADVVTAVNGALPSSEYAPSLFGMRVWSNTMSVIVPYSGTIPIGATGIGEWQDELNNPSAQDEAGWGWWYDDMFKIPNLGTLDNVEVKLLYDPALSGGEPVVDGGFQLDTDTGYLCVKFGKAVNVATNKLFAKLIITRNNYT
jgi:hypothetical protein